MKTMQKVWLRPLVPGKVKTLKLTLVSPPWATATVGQQITWLGCEWIVTKVVATKGVFVGNRNRRER